MTLIIFDFSTLFNFLLIAGFHDAEINLFVINIKYNINKIKLIKNHILNIEYRNMIIFLKLKLKQKKVESYSREQG